jgi:hypothetical protein
MESGMEDSEQSGSKIKTEHAQASKYNPVVQALANILENQESVCTCQLMSELDSLAEKEQAAEDKKPET